MSTLHNRGYRPKPGERIDTECEALDDEDATRYSWRISWQDIRSDQGPDVDHLDTLAHQALDARLAPDPIVWAKAARIIKVSGLGRGDGDRMAPGLVARRNARRADG